MHILTFDIEDWYLSYHSSQIAPVRWPAMESRTERNTRTLLRFLEEHELKATFFILGFESGKNPALVRDIRKAGHDIGFHSVWHVPLFAMSAKAFENDLKEGLSQLEDIVGEKVVLYRAPMFSLDKRVPWAPELLAANGIEVSSSVQTGIDFAGIRLPDVPFVWQTSAGQLIELPMPARHFGRLKLRITGSGYFRALPACYLRSYTRRKSYNMFYFHPRDFDLEVPKSPLLPAYRNAMNRLGNRSTQPKLTYLVRSNNFISISQAVENLQGQALPIVDLRPST
jgi:polysaccharide deacetylase family protein (PEP-CTERM system associated)